MTLERQVIFWVVALAVFSGVLWLLSPVLLPFIAGMALAYLLDPLARFGERFGMKTELGAYLDPLADKVLIVSIYVTLGITAVIPLWIVILVVSHDFMIVGAIILSWVVDRPVKIKPHLISKLNTGVQIAFACLVLASFGYAFDAEPLLTLVMALVAVLTLVSVGLYVGDWIRHMNSAEAGK